MSRRWRDLTPIQRTTRVLVWATPAVWIAWDVFAWLHERTAGTESHYIWTLSLRHWWFPPLLGAAGLWLWLHFFVDPSDPLHRSWWSYWRWTRRGIHPTDDNPEHHTDDPDSVQRRQRRADPGHPGINHRAG